jgi:replication factor A1
MTESNNIVNDIHEQLSEHVDVDEAEVRERVETLREYSVPDQEIRRSVVQNLANEAGVDPDAVFGDGTSEDEVVPVDEVEERGDGVWLDAVEVEFVDEWDPNSDSIGQVGLLADASGTIKFISWATSDVQELEEGQTYRIGPVITDEYEGRYSVQLNGSTEVEEIDEDQVESQFEEGGRPIEGVLMNVQSGSGLIKRCKHDDCSRVLQNGRCSEHGDIEGEFDLRIKATLDDGRDAEAVLFNEEMTTELTGITLEEAQDMAMDALDTSVVAQAIKNEIVGTYVTLRGQNVGSYFLVNEIEDPGPVELEALADGSVELDAGDGAEPAEAEAAD